MERRHFIKTLCTVGCVCSCGIGHLASKAVASGEPSGKNEDWRASFVQDRYAKLLALMGERMDARAFGSLMEDLGRFCASRTGIAQRFPGDPDGFFGELRHRWHADIAYDRDHGKVSIAFAAGSECVCPLLKKGLASGSACQCSVGSLKGLFEEVFGGSPDVRIVESVLRGGQRCLFEVTVAKASAKA